MKKEGEYVAVEKMQMMNLVAPLDDMHDLLQEIVLIERIHIKNAVKEIQDSNFTLAVLEEHLDSIADMGSIVEYKANKSSYKTYQDKLSYLANALDMILEPKTDLDRKRDIEDAVAELDSITRKVAPIQDKLTEREETLNRYEDFLESIEYLKDINIDVSALSRMKHFNYHIGTLTKDKRLKLRNNYENISAIVLHIGSSVDGEAYLIFSPAQLEYEAERILKSLNFKEIPLPAEFEGVPSEIYQKIQDVIMDVKLDIQDLKNQIAQLKRDYEDRVDRIYSRVLLEERIENLKDHAAISEHFFYFSGWIPEVETEKIKQKLEEVCSRVIVVFAEVDEVPKRVVPPTKLKNSWILKPFELLVNLYGVPNYKELDPTIFLGLTYLILFGAMFGDVGQGAILFLAGWMIRKKESLRTSGEIMLRIGLSSVFFGFMYGSVFGFEEYLPALLVHPIENIDFVLYSSIVFGVVLLLISFGISISNLLKIKDYEQGVFGRNGIVGLLFYVVLLVGVLELALSGDIAPISILIIVGIVLLAMMLFKKPLTALLFRQPAVYHEGKKEYYIEGGFDLVETLLSLLSNTISFIRVGAFALNHVGLFLAFTTMANLSNNRAIGAVILIAGNIIIIGLEGLIVFIQGLRLEYYELFSKYYTGDGIAYSPFKLNLETEERK